jgi:hypothetical protein
MRLLGKCIAIAMLAMIMLFSGCKTTQSSADTRYTATNPFLPLWEHIPDAEPYIFEDPDKPGEMRVYLYGSHDVLKTSYCGHDQVVWSAPVNDLRRWRYDGVIFESKLDAHGNPLNEGGVGDILFAPDVAMVTDADGKKRYYLYPNCQSWQRSNMVAWSDRPDGPFTVCNWNNNNARETVGALRFDPAVFVDDDGRVYGYWGYKESWGAELDPATMATIKEGTHPVKDMVPNLNQDDVFRFYEASSMRKIKDKYVFVYSRWTGDGEFGLHDSNYTLAYAYSNSPLGPFTYGGTIIDGRGRDTNADGDTIYTATITGNTHGSILEIQGQWYVFYHRQTGTNEFSRQAMVAPIEVRVTPGPDGKVEISEGEYTSEGFAVEGLNPLERHSAGIACYHTGPKGMKEQFPNFSFSGSYIQPQYADYDGKSDAYDLNINHNPVVNNTDGSVVGYKYFNFNLINGKRTELRVKLKPQGVDGAIDIMLDSPWEKKNGRKIGSLTISKNETQELTEKRIRLQNLKNIKGKHALFFVFTSPDEGTSICELHDFVFVE